MNFELSEEELANKSKNENSYKSFLSKVGFNYYENKHFMPNEIFDDLISSNIKPVHMAFTYSYYYLISWLYRYGKYGELSINNGFIKELLGYNSNNKLLNYIMKENGILDSMNYTKTTKNYSIGIQGTYRDNAPKFLLVNDLSQSERNKLYKKINRNFKAKYPIKHMHRYTEDLEEEMFTGIYYDPSNTHQVNFDVFAFSMSNNSIGTIGFYIYCFLKNKYQMFQGAYQVSYEQLSEETNIPYSTLAKYLDNLRGYGMIVGIQNQEYYVEGLSSRDRESNYYLVNDSVEDFYFIKEEYTKIRGINLEQYNQIKKNSFWDG